MNVPLAARCAARALAAVCLLGALTVVAAPSASAMSERAASAGSGFKLVFKDDFNGRAGRPVDRNWIYDLGTGYGCSGCPDHWGTGEVETMTDSTQNVFTDAAGNLVIRALRQPDGSWTSGRIESRRTDFSAGKHGILRVEARLQQPDVSGDAAAGYWPAFWMLGKQFRGNYLNWPGIGEIDIMEDVNGSSDVFSTLHCGVAPGGPCNEFSGIGSGPHNAPGLQTSFHTYAMELDKSVEPNQLRFYLDGVNYFTIDSTQVDPETWANATNHGFFVIFDLAMGGGFPDAGCQFAFAPPTGCPYPTPNAGTVSGGALKVDWVAVYQKR